jgi:hypothetical protein
MDNFIVKREDGQIVSNSAERNIILLRYAAFLNENENNAGVHQIHPQASIAPQIQIIEQPVQQQPTPKKSTKASAAQNAQGANVQANQKLSG